jgi:adenylosuccinate synthase
MLARFLRRRSMPTTCVVGILWGDEGKGKVIDYLAAEADYIVRYGGGHNAGHTLILPSGKLVLHLVPSGIVHSHTVNVIGNGVVIDPVHLCSEIEKLQGRGLDVRLGHNLLLSERAHVILEAHRRQDQWTEGQRGSGRIGTTGRGIGPAYSDRCSRIGLRLGDLLQPGRLRKALQGLAEHKNAWFGPIGLPAIDVAATFEQLAAAGDRLRPGIVDAGLVLRQALAAGKRIVLEGAQGCLLDLEHGTYPFVTSSHASTGGAFSGTGLPPHAMRVIGIAKAYATRVGEGPFPTELKDELGDRLRTAGKEFGSTTGRPRRCGWFDAVAVRYSGAVSGATELVLTNLDVLRGFSPLRIAVRYRLPDGATTTQFPAFDLEAAVPEWVELPGFDEDLQQVRRFEDLPRNAQAYVRAIEEHAGLPIRTISVGPERQQVVVR